jgi:hypothetical protein
MPAKDRTHAVRITALALAGAVNVLFVSLWLLSRAQVAPVAAVTAMIWLTAPMPSPSLPKPFPRQEERERSRVRTLPIAPPAPALVSDTAISVSPIDWDAEGARSARNLRDEGREKPGPALDSKPRVLVLPDQSNLLPQAGDTEHFEGGEVITWVNEVCYYTNQPGPMNFGGESRKVCKVRSMHERRSEALAAELEKAVTPDYLTRPLLLPIPEP